LIINILKRSDLPQERYRFSINFPTRVFNDSLFLRKNFFEIENLKKISSLFFLAFLFESWQKEPDFILYFIFINILAKLKRNLGKIF